jgi:thiol-disulfide isomerase/thioredoxin
MKKRMFCCFLLSISIMAVFAQKTTTLPASEIIAKSLRTAKSANKKVLVKFTASWCIWCHRMDAAIQDTSINQYFTDNYIMIAITVMETPSKVKEETVGGMDYLKKYGGANQGLPYWVVLDAKEEVLANSKLKPDDKPLNADGDNVGCPTEQKEVAYFIRVLKNTSTLTSVALEKIRKKFEAISNK